MNMDVLSSNVNVVHHIKSYEEKKATLRKKQLLCLVHQFLKDEGYFETATNLCREAPSLNQYDVCDNIDLSTVIQEFETYYYLRFQKYPKLCKKKDISDSVANPVINKKNNLALKKKLSENDHVSENKNDTSQKNKVSEKITPKLCDMDLTITPLLSSYGAIDNIPESNCDQILKPLSGFDALPTEFKDLAEIISREICTLKPNIHWSDIIGLDEAKQILKEAIVYPIKYPNIFSGIISPWKGLLLYGPPGTGKTLLAQAVATECKTTFFSISASSVVSKWRGDSEKLIRVMFQLAQYHAPSTIFLDELDGLASHRNNSSEHEGSRRLKTELFIQLDNISKCKEKIFVLATSNLPWELDAAILRRFEKRILVGLPDKEMRCSLFLHYLPPKISKEPSLTSCVDYDSIAKISEGYSGSDIKLICKEAAIQAVRPIFKSLEQQKQGEKLPNIEVITTDDVKRALEKTKPTAQHVMPKYCEWQKAFGSL